MGTVSCNKFLSGCLSFAVLPTTTIRRITTHTNNNNNNNNTNLLLSYYKHTPLPPPKNVVVVIIINNHNNNNLHFTPSSSSTFPVNYKLFPGKCLPPTGFTAFSSAEEIPPPQIALLLEVDGVLMDAYRLGNRPAFNLAFKKLGLDCANWTEPIYLDLLRKSNGDEERMLILYFNRIGWPTSLPTSEKGAFVKNILREKKHAFDELMISESSPLRPGAANFIDDATKEGIPVVILTSYGKSEEKIIRSVVEKLGPERISRVTIVGKEEVERSLYGQLTLGKGVLSGTDEELANEARKAVSAEKQRIAKEVASMLKLSVDVDTSSCESLDNVVAALRAGAEYTGVPVSNCVLIAGSQSGVAGAERIGMPCVVLRSSFTSRAEFPSANAVMDGFGGADLTISKLQNKQQS